MAFKDTLQICKYCKLNYKANSNSQKYCSATCQKGANKESIEASQKKYKAKQNLEPMDNKKRCLICNKYFYKVGAHIYQIHGWTAREYRKQYNLPLKRGILAKDIRKKLANNCRMNKTIDNLNEGKPYRYTKGDQRAIINTGWKGKAKLLDTIDNEIY